MIEMLVAALQWRSSAATGAAVVERMRTERGWIV